MESIHHHVPTTTAAATVTPISSSNNSKNDRIITGSTTHHATSNHQTRGGTLLPPPVLHDRPFVVGGNVQHQQHIKNTADDIIDPMMNNNNNGHHTDHCRYHQEESFIKAEQQQQRRRRRRAGAASGDILLGNPQQQQSNSNGIVLSTTNTHRMTKTKDATAFSSSYSRIIIILQRSFIQLRRFYIQLPPMVRIVLFALIIMIITALYKYIFIRISIWMTLGISSSSSTTIFRKGWYNNYKKKTIPSALLSSFVVNTNQQQHQHEQQQQQRVLLQPPQQQLQGEELKQQQQQPKKLFQLRQYDSPHYRNNQSHHHEKNAEMMLLSTLQQIQQAFQDQLVQWLQERQEGETNMNSNGGGGGGAHNNNKIQQLQWQYNSKGIGLRSKRVPIIKALLQKWIQIVNDHIDQNIPCESNYMRPYLLPPFSNEHDDYTSNNNKNNQEEKEDADDTNGKQHQFRSPNKDDMIFQSIPKLALKYVEQDHLFGHINRNNGDDNNNNDGGHNRQFFWVQRNNVLASTRMKWQQEWDQWVYDQQQQEPNNITSNNSMNHINHKNDNSMNNPQINPVIDYTNPNLYQYSPLLSAPPRHGGYPILKSLGQLLQDWPQDEDYNYNTIIHNKNNNTTNHSAAKRVLRHGGLGHHVESNHHDTTTANNNNRIQETLLHFNYSDPKELHMARLFRDAALPFKLYNVPDLIHAHKKWTDEYLARNFEGGTRLNMGGIGNRMGGGYKKFAQGAMAAVQRRFLGNSGHDINYTVGNSNPMINNVDNLDDYEDDTKVPPPPPAHGTVQESDSNFFAFFVPRMWNVLYMGIPPTRNNDWSYAQWSFHARYADTISLSSNKPHYYFQAGIPPEERHKDYKLWTFISRDLPLFSSPNETFFVFHPNEQKGIQCRFGERGVVAATHYDGGQNMVAMITGAKRYILAPPNQCSKLGIFTNNRSPIFRHSLLNFGNIRYLQDNLESSNMNRYGSTMSPQERAWLRRASTSLAVETVVKAGEVLFIPSHWFHYIVSLQKSAQCNVRSGIDEIGSKEFGGLQDVHECK